MSTQGFFREGREQSLVKATIVSKYFWAWAKVIIPNVKRRHPHGGGKIAYLDLFAGPGRYEDGTKSTPLLILEKAIEEQDCQEMLKTTFNDKDEESVRSLDTAIRALPGIGRLKHTPIVRNHEVGTELVKMFDEMRFVPTLFFVDPWGYKGLSLQLVSSVLKDWGCDCIFFFNYNRISMGLSNPAVKEHMAALFGQERADALRERLKSMASHERELTIIEELAQALGAKSGRYVLPFRFRDDRGTRTSHHLIFVSKNVLGYSIMKDIMAKESSSSEQGVPSFEFSPADRRQPLLFELARPLEDLEGLVLREFAGQTLTMKQVFERHNVGRRYIKKNYKEVLAKMEREGKIAAHPDAEHRKKGTFADRVRVTFPKATE